MHSVGLRQIENQRRYCRIAEALARVGVPCDREVWELHEAARLHCGSHFTAVDVGDPCAATTIAIGLGLAERGGGRLVAVRPAEGSDHAASEWDATLRSVGLEAMVETAVGRRQGLTGLVSEEEVGLLIFRGAASCLEALEHVEAWAHVLAHGAVVGFDSPDQPDVARAIEGIAQSGTPFRRPRVVRSIFFDYTPNQPWWPRDVAATLRLKLFLRAVCVAADPALHAGRPALLRQTHGQRTSGRVRALRALLPPAGADHAGSARRPFAP